MPRMRRIHVPGGIYHAILRGNHREPIFHRDADVYRLNDLVADAVQRYGLRLHAYCWMPNHIHLAIQIGETELGRSMQLIASRYARYVQRRVPTTGHLFQRRHRALLVQDERYLLELVRYIHLNPVRAGLVEGPAEYPWSGHCEYLGGRRVGWLMTEAILSRFGRDAGEARARYEEFVMAGVGVEPDVVLRAGDANDRRVIGSKPPGPDSRETQMRAESVAVQYAHRLPILSVARNAECSGLPASVAVPPTLEWLIEEACARNSMTPSQLCDARRSRACTRVRAVVTHRALGMGLATLEDLGQRFGRSASTLSEGLERYRREEPELFRTAAE